MPCSTQARHSIKTKQFFTVFNNLPLPFHRPMYLYKVDMEGRKGFQSFLLAMCLDASCYLAKLQTGGQSAILTTMFCLTWELMDNQKQAGAQPSSAQLGNTINRWPEKVATAAPKILVERPRATACEAKSLRLAAKIGQVTIWLRGLPGDCARSETRPPTIRAVLEPVWGMVPKLREPFITNREAALGSAVGNIRRSRACTVGADSFGGRVLRYFLRGRCPSSTEYDRGRQIESASPDGQSFLGDQRIIPRRIEIRNMAGRWRKECSASGRFAEATALDRAAVWLRLSPEQRGVPRWEIYLWSRRLSRGSDHIERVET